MFRPALAVLGLLTVAACTNTMDRPPQASEVTPNRATGAMTTTVPTRNADNMSQLSQAADDACGELQGDARFLGVRDTADGPVAVFSCNPGR